MNGAEFDFGEKLGKMEAKILAYSGDKPSDYARGQIDGYNQALSDLQDLIKAEIKNLATFFKDLT